MRIVFMGTSDFAVPALGALVKKGEDISLVVTQPDRPKGRGKKTSPPPVKEAALTYGLEIAQPDKITNNEFFLKLLKKASPDLIVVVSYGKILPKEILEIPRVGCINIHASLLPKFRGSAPVQRAILAGEEKTGVTLMHMSEGLDEGDIIAVRETAIDNKNATELFDELAALGADLLIDEIDDIGRSKPIPQSSAGISYAPMIRREEGHIDFKDSPCYIGRLSRAMQQWPGVYAYYDEQKVKFFDVSAVQGDSTEKAGTVIKADDGGLIIKAGEGLIRVGEIQFPGKRRMSVSEFLKGNGLQEGEVFK